MEDTLGLKRGETGYEGHYNLVFGNLEFKTCTVNSAYVKSIGPEKRSDLAKIQLMWGHKNIKLRKENLYRPAT